VRIVPRAAFQISIPKDAIDADKGFIPACKLAQVNRLATFAGKDGKPVEILITPGLIDGLLGLGQKQGRLDAFWTHDRLSDENQKDHLHDYVAVWKNFRKDETGDLIADAQLAPTPYKDRIMWSAMNDPEGMMVSMVFDYTGGRNDAKPTAICSGDFVKLGAATSALLSAYPNQTDTDMTKEEIQAIVKEAITAALATFKPAAVKSEDDMTEADATAIMTAAGVTDADQTAEDKGKPPGVRAMLAVGRANKRQLAAVAEEAGMKAEAAFTAKLGAKVKEVIGTGGNDKTKDEFEAAVQAQLAAGAPNRARAVFRVQKDKPDLYAKHAQALRA